MARIPIYQQRVSPNGQGAAANMQGARFISGEGQGFEAVASGLDKIAGAVERGEQVDFALEKDRIESEARIHFASMSSDFDKKQYEFLTEAKTKTAPGAPKFHDTYIEQFDKFSQETLKNAPSQYARQLLQGHISRAREAFGKDAFLFEHSEHQRNLGQQFDEGVKKDASLVYANPALFDTSMGKWGFAADGFQGKPEVRAKLRELAVNTLAAAAVKGAIDRNPGDAVGLLDAWSKDQTATIALDGAKVPIGMLDFKQQQQLVEYARQKQKEADAQQNANVFITAANGAVGSAPLLPGDIIDLPAAKAAAVSQATAAKGGKLEPKDQLQLESYVEKVAADRERDVKRAREAVIAGAFQKLDANGGDYQALVRDNPSILSGLDPTQRIRVNEYAGKVATGATQPTDWQAYNLLASNPAALKASNLDSMRDKFNAAEFVQLKKAQEKLISDPGEEQNIVGTHSLLKGMLEEAGYKNQPKKQAQFFSLVQQAVDQELAASGKKALPQARVKEIAADLLVKEVTSRGVIFDSKDEAFDITVPPAERVKIEAALKSQGLPVTDYTVLNAYRRKLNRSATVQPVKSSGMVEQIPK